MCQRKLVGVSLIEVMVTIAILAIFLTVALPTFNGWAENRRLKGAGESIRSVIVYAQSEAVRTASSTQVTITTGSGWSVLAGTTPSRLVEATEYPGVTLALGASFASGTITFEPKRAEIVQLGASSANQEIITIQTSNANRLQLQGGRAGMLSLCTPTGFSGYPACP